MLSRYNIVNRVTSFLPMLQPGVLQVRVMASGVATDGYTGYPMPKVRAMDPQNAAHYFPMSSEILTAKKKCFELYSNMLALAGAPAPAVGNRLVVGGVTWTVEEVVGDINSAIFRCLCTQMVS